MLTPLSTCRALAAAFLVVALTGAIPCPAQGQPPAEPPPPPPATKPAPSASTPATRGVQPPGPATEASRAVPADPDDGEIETSLTLVDGNRATGVLVERTPERIVLLINGIRTPYSSDSIAQVETLPPVTERYRQMRAKIGDDEIDQRLLLAQWLRTHRKYQLALDEVSGVLGREPRNPQAVQLKTWLEEQLKLRAMPQVRAAPGGPFVRAEPRAQRPDQDFPTLSPEQINLIRVFEVDLADPPRMIIDRDAVTALINQFASDPLIPAGREARDAIYHKQPAQILDLMFRLRARDFYGRVQVMSDPRSMKMFRERVHSTWLMNSCATSTCHGGENAGRLYLATRQPNSDATVYTNFLILDRFRLRDKAARDPAPGSANAAGDTGRPLIDYDDPARSPLLHMALARNESLTPHPQVQVAGGRFKPINPVFNSVNDRRYQDAIDWIRSMYMPRPDYPVQYTPPVPGAPGQPVLGEAGGGKKNKADPIGGKR